jgi:hypothetical protein
MSQPKEVLTELGVADKLTMDEFVRTMVKQMFENDNDTATLEVSLNGTDNKDTPKLELEVRLTSINGTPTRADS